MDGYAPAVSLCGKIFFNLEFQYLHWNQAGLDRETDEAMGKRVGASPPFGQ
jgi:hypothetical protein